MKSKERRRLRRCRHSRARENYRRNKRDWVYRFGPRVVMDEPTEEHVKALLMKWVSVNKLIAEIQEDLGLRGRPFTTTQLMKMFFKEDADEIVALAMPSGIRSAAMQDAWARVMQLAIGL